MIFYFSGTGNSAWAARFLADLTSDRTFDICCSDPIPNITEEKQIGFIFPVYAWGIPEPMVTFAKKLAPSSAFTFGLCTCGAEAGNTMKQFSKIYRLDSRYSLIMPNNYIVGTDIERDEIIRKKLDTAHKELQKISRSILLHQPANHVRKGTLAGLKSSLIHYGFDTFARSAKPFFTTDSCNGCGLCSRNCPASAIRLTDGHPVWSSHCYQCMRCIHACPQQAIQYGKHTQNRRRYHLSAYLGDLEHPN